MLQSRFPRLYALVRDRHALVSHCWTNAWVPEARGRLSAPHSLELLDIQHCLAAFQPSEAETDKWLWSSTVFSTRAAYGQLGTGSPSNPASTLAACRLIWKRRIPLKVKIFGWLLLRQCLPTRYAHSRWSPKVSASCPMCSREDEDCTHLFFQYPVAQEAWNLKGTFGVDTRLAESFWDSTRHGPYRCEAEWQKLFALLWALWRHRNEVLFQGRPPSATAAIYNVWACARIWHQGL